jgi:hypothetical protein
MRSTLGEHPHRAFPVMSEMEVVPNIDLNRVNAFMDVMTNELIRADLRKFEIEGFGDDGIEAQIFQRLDLLIERIEQA